MIALKKKGRVLLIHISIMPCLNNERIENAFHCCRSEQMASCQHYRIPPLKFITFTCQVIETGALHEADMVS